MQSHRCLFHEHLSTDKKLDLIRVAFHFQAGPIGRLLWFWKPAGYIDPDLRQSSLVSRCGRRREVAVEPPLPAVRRAAFPPGT